MLAFHIIISLVAIVAGFMVFHGMLHARRLDRTTAIFLVTTILTSATGFLLPAERILPSHIIGALSLVLLTVAVYARYGAKMAGRWRTGYVVTALAALYFNTFVLVVQAFLQIPVLHALAPTGTEPPFAIAQIAVMIFFFAVGRKAKLAFAAA